MEFNEELIKKMKAKRESTDFLVSMLAEITGDKHFLALNKYNVFTNTVKTVMESDKFMKEDDVADKFTTLLEQLTQILNDFIKDNNIEVKED